MLDGVTVLNKMPVKDNPEWLLHLFCVGIIFVVFVLFFTMIIKTKDIVGSIMATMLGVIIWMGLFIIPFLTISTDTGKYKYQVTIDSSVKLKEFNSKYTILRQEGDIYTIILK